ncbi:response regulator [Aquimarina sp. M1]
MRISIVGLFLLSTVSFYGQNSSKIDSLIKLAKYDDAFQLASEDLITAKKSSSPLLLGKAQGKIADLFFKKGQYDSTRYYAKKALALGINHELPEVITNAYLSIGNIHYSKFEDLDAITTFQKIDSISRHTDYKNQYVVRALFNLGKVLLRTYSVQDTSYIGKAEGYFKRAIKMASEIDNAYYQHCGYVMRGNIYAQRKEYEKAMPFYRKSMTYFIGTGSTKDLSEIYWSLGIIYTDLNRYDKADSYYQLRLQLLTETGDKYHIANAHRTYAGFLYRISQHKKAIPYFLEAYHYFENFDAGKSGVLLGITRNLAISYQEVEDFENATKFFSLSGIYRDSLEVRKQKSLALDLEAKYQNKQKEQEIKLLSAQKKAIEIQKNNQRTIFLMGLAVFLIAAMFLYVALRNRQKLNKKLKELDRAKSRFFENISHEFRTPLSLIFGPIEEQLKKETLTPQEKRALTIAKKNSERLLLLVDQLLDLSKLESDHYNLNVQESDLSQFLKGIISSYKYQSEINNQEFVATTNLHYEESWFDRDVLEKIITNLLGNALKYTPEGNKILISSQKNNSQLYLEIKNTGTTLTDEELSNIFSRFHRAHENTTGTGIGLALTKELVELHKGTITALSDEISVRFVVTIPVNKKVYREEEVRYQKQTHIPRSEKPLPERIQNEKIEIEHPSNSTDDPMLLIVDDNAELREYLSSLFSDRFNIKTAKDGKEGFKKALKYVPDVIITDLMMPNENGLQLTKNSKTNPATSHIPIVMLTAKADDKDKLTGIEIGADIYVTKPFHTEILTATINNLLESRNRLQERFSQEVVLTPKDVSVNSYDQQFLNDLQDVMNTNLIESDFNAENFATVLHMSRMQLHRKLKALTGLSTTEFIRNQRLKLASQLLKKSETNISQVGYAVGFNNHSYFTKCFREQFGMSPSDYAKS